MRKQAVLLIIFAFLLALSACGGDNTAAQTSAEPNEPSAAAQTSAETSASAAGTELPHTVSLYIYCTALIEDLSVLDEEKRELVPPDGVILALTDVEFEDGESVFSILRRETRREKISFEYTNTPGFGTAYVEGIANLYERDAGATSGWTYCVNGEYPGYGCSSYTVEPGDVIEWYYVLDAGSGE